MPDFNLNKQQLKLINEYRTSRGGGMIFSDEAIISVLKSEGKWISSDALKGSLFENSFNNNRKLFEFEFEKSENDNNTSAMEAVKQTPVNEKELNKFVKDYEISDYLLELVKENIKTKEQLNILKEIGDLKDQNDTCVYSGDDIIRFFSGKEPDKKLKYSKELMETNPEFVKALNPVKIVNLLAKDGYTEDEKAAIMENADFFHSIISDNWIDIPEKRLKAIADIQKNSKVKMNSLNFNNLQLLSDHEFNAFLKASASGEDISAYDYKVKNDKNFNLPIIAMVPDKDIQDCLFKLNNESDLNSGKYLKKIALGLQTVDDKYVLNKIKNSLQNIDDENSLSLPAINNLLKTINYQKFVKTSDAVFFDEDAKNLLKMLKDNSDLSEVYQEINEAQKSTTLTEDILIKLGLKDGVYISSAVDDLIEQIKVSPMIDFISTCADDSLTNYIYETYYIKDKPEAEALREIDKKYNCKIFLTPSEDYSNTETLEFINKEFGKWKTVSDGEAVLPEVLNLNTMKSAYYNFANEWGGAAGYASDKQIHIDGNFRCEYALRHEVMHLNDKKRLYDNVDVKTEASKWRSEFTNAGITDNHTNYAYKNKNEFVAVAAEGDFSKYSKEFKEYLKTLGMPEWVFNLPYEK